MEASGRDASLFCLVEFVYPAQASRPAARNPGGFAPGMPEVPETEACVRRTVYEQEPGCLFSASGMGRTASALAPGCPGAVLKGGGLLNGRPSAAALRKWVEKQ